MVIKLVRSPAATRKKLLHVRFLGNAWMVIHDRSSICRLLQEFEWLLVNEGIIRSIANKLAFNGEDREVWRTPHYELLNLVTSVFSPWDVSLKPDERMFEVR